MLRNLFLILLSLPFCIHLIGQNRAQLRLKAAAAYSTGDYLAAIKYSEQALPLTKQDFGEYSEKYRTNLTMVAFYNMEAGQIEVANKFYNKALDISLVVDSGSNMNYANLLFNIGQTHLFMGQFDLAESYMLKADKLLKTLVDPNSLEYSFHLEKMGILYANLAQYDKAEKYYLQSQEKAYNLVENRGVRYVNVTLSLAELYESTNKPKQAEKLFLTADSVARVYLLGTPDSLNLWRTLKCLGKFYMNQGKLNKVESYLNKAADFAYYLFGYNIEYAEVMGLLSHYYYLKGDYLKAESHLYEELDAYKKSIGKDNIYACRNNLSLVQVLDKLPGVLDYKSKLLAQAINKYKKHIFNQAKVLSETELSKYLEAEKRHRNALITTYYRNSKVDSVRWVYYPLFDYLMLNNGLQLRSASQLNVILSTSSDSTLVGLYNNWKVLSKQIADQQTLSAAKRNQELPNWIEQANGMEKELTGKVSSLRSYDPTTIDYSDSIFYVLPPNSVAIEYVMFDLCDKNGCSDSTMYAAFVISKRDSNLSFIPLFNESRLTSLFEGTGSNGFKEALYRGAETGGDNNIAGGLSDSIYQLAIQPLEKHLRNATHVYYSPVGYLNKISFDAIKVNGRYLSDIYALNRMTSVINLIEPVQPININKVQLFGGISFDVDSSAIKSDTQMEEFEQSVIPKDLNRGSGWNYLPGTKKEVNEISSLLTKNSITNITFTGKDATEANFMKLNGQSSPSIMHIATHGFFYPLSSNQNNMEIDGQPSFVNSPDPLLRSGFLMSGANNTWKGQKLKGNMGDGIITAREISNLYFANTELVILSACETGLGDISDSEGVMGLHRAFKIAGVEYLMISLWQVPDLETSEFMINFYADLLKLKSIPDAFRTTQNKMKEKYKNEPYKWAGFVLVR